MGTKSPRRRFKKVLAVLGSCILLLPCGMQAFWANLVTYVDSYSVARLESSSRDHTPWALSVYLMAQIIGNFVLGYLHKVCSRGWTLLLGIISVFSGISLSYLSIQSSMAWFIVTMAGMFGFGCGVLMAMAMLLMVEIAEKDLGLLNSMVSASRAIGAISINQLATLYINPLNKIPDLELAGFKYFTNKDIVDKVPSFFLIFGGISMCCHILGTCLLYDIVLCGAQRSDDSDKFPVKEPEDDNSKKESDRHTITSIDSEDRTDMQTRSPTDYIGEIANHCSNSSKESESNSSHDSNHVAGKQYSPKQIIKTRLFYIMWMIFFLTDLLYLFNANYFKLFGQIWIPDDHFLTDVATARVFINSWARMIWGTLVDKMGVKSNLIADISLVILVSVWYYPMTMRSRWLYASMTVLYGTGSSAIFTCYTSSIALLFGQKHFSFNFALFEASSIAAYLVSPVINETLLMKVGWFYTFTTLAFVSVSSLVLTCRYWPRL